MILKAGVGSLQDFMKNKMSLSSNSIVKGSNSEDTIVSSELLSLPIHTKSIIILSQVVTSTRI